jgi:hypothetical protein
VKKFGYRQQKKMHNSKTSIRPQIPTVTGSPNLSSTERFQNQTLRPIIKLQHDLIIACLSHHLDRRRVRLEDLEPLKKSTLMNSLFSTDTPLKSNLRGLIIGLFTLEEYCEYLSNSSALNKRIHSIIQKRIYSTLLITH